MRLLKRRGNGKHAITVVDPRPERRPWVLAPVVWLHDWCEKKEAM